MKTVTNIRNAGSLAFAILICFAAQSFGQNAIPVGSEAVANYGIRDAKLVSVWVPRTDDQTNVEIKEKQTRLVFSAPSSDLNLNVVLTAFSSDGSTLGQSVWCSRTVNASLSSAVTLDSGSRSSKGSTFSLTVDPSLLKAVKYSMSVIPPASDPEPGQSPGKCSECASVASGVCGAKEIKSMTCGGTSGTCTFVCNDR